MHGETVRAYLVVEIGLDEEVGAERGRAGLGGGTGPLVFRYWAHLPTEPLIPFRAGAVSDRRDLCSSCEPYAFCKILACLRRASFIPVCGGRPS